MIAPSNHRKKCFTATRSGHGGEIGKGQGKLIGVNQHRDAALYMA